jgi:hypothetical protein
VSQCLSILVEVGSEECVGADTADRVLRIAGVGGMRLAPT